MSKAGRPRHLGLYEADNRQRTGMSPAEAEAYLRSRGIDVDRLRGRSSN